MTDDQPPPSALELEKVYAEAERLKQQAEKTFGQLVAAIKKQERAEPDSVRPGAAVTRLAQELRTIDAQLAEASRQLQAAVGISDAELDLIEQAGLPSYDDRWWRREIVDTPPTESLDELTPPALKALLQRVDNEWLSRQSAASYRLDDVFLNKPLHLVGGVRVVDSSEASRPQRFAHMLLVAIDHLDKRDDLDFFSAAMFVPELTALGHRLELLSGLGDEAIRKFERLPLTADDEVQSTIFELLVGTACLLKGRAIHMLPTSGAGKSPDFRIYDLGAPAVIECKRRQGLTRYERDEARLVEKLYRALRPLVDRAGLHGSLELRFEIPIRQIDAEAFVDSLTRTLSQSEDIDVTETAWGSFSYQRLPICGDVPDTRLYSPDFLHQVFGWSSTDCDWDGLLCEVEPPPRVRVRRFRFPFCIKWRSESAEAVVKRVRDVTSLWARAAKQVPAGEVGFIYISYSEGQRGELADARTRHIIAKSEQLWHRWSIRIPVTVISRLYARPLGIGVPDLIESSLPGVSKGEEHWLAQLPSRVFFVKSPWKDSDPL